MELVQFKSEILPLRPQLYTYACKVLGNETDAEDAVQEVLLRLWNLRERLSELDNPAGFVMQTTKNICIDKLRSKKYLTEIEDNLLINDQMNPHYDAEQNDSVQIVREIIEKLPELQKRIIWMRDVEGYELGEIATITGTQLSAVTMNLSRARKKVREKFIQINDFIKQTT